MFCTNSFLCSVLLEEVRFFTSNNNIKFIKNCIIKKDPELSISALLTSFDRLIQKMEVWIPALNDKYFYDEQQKETVFRYQASIFDPLAIKKDDDELLVHNNVMSALVLASILSEEKIAMDVTNNLSIDLSKIKITTENYIAPSLTIALLILLYSLAGNGNMVKELVLKGAVELSKANMTRSRSTESANDDQAFKYIASSFLWPFFTHLDRELRMYEFDK